MKWVLGIFFIISVLAFIFIILHGKISSYSPPFNNITPKAQKQNTTLIAAGDIACSKNGSSIQECQQNETARLIQKQNPDMVLALGDLEYESSHTIQHYDKAWGSFKAITYPVLGNHEYENNNIREYFDYFDSHAGKMNKGYLSINKENWHLIGLNSNCWVAGCSPGSEQYEWLKKDLEHNNSLCTIAYWHHPLFSSGTHGNNEFMRDIWKLLYEKQVDIVLNGHEHLYERFAPQDASGKTDMQKGVREFIVGTGGRNLYAFDKIKNNSEVRANTVFGVLKFILHADSYSWEFLAINGKSIDTGSDKCH